MVDVMYALKENKCGDLEWHKTDFVNLGSQNKPNLDIKQVKIQPEVYLNI